MSTLIHDDCGTPLDLGWCPKCKFSPDMQSTSFKDVSDRTLAIIKPDGFGAAGPILQRLYQSGLAVVALWTGRATLATWQSFYQEHAARPFFADLCAFMASGPVVVLALSEAFPEKRDPALAHLQVWEVWRILIGPTNPRAGSDDGTLRFCFGDRTEGAPLWRNAVHGSDSAESAARELAFWFSPEQLGAELNARAIEGEVTWDVDEPDVPSTRFRALLGDKQATFASGKLYALIAYGDGRWEVRGGPSGNPLAFSRAGDLKAAKTTAIRVARALRGDA